MNLVYLWTALVGVVLILYIILDGFSLGVGLLFPTATSEQERSILMNSIAPVWDANQTWIVFGGGALFAVFPLIYTVLFSALYIPLLTFLFGLIFRGVAFEFRANSTMKVQWNRAFFLGSLIAVVGQGMVLGGYISGIRTEKAIFAGGPFDWLNPFTLTVSLGLIAGYILLGSTFVIIKTSGVVQNRAYRQALTATIAVAILIAVLSVWTPFHQPDIWSRWLSRPRIYYIWVFPLLGIIEFILIIRSLRRKMELFPFFYSIALFLTAYFGLQAAILPYAVPPGITIYDAAAQKETLVFTLFGVAIVLPVVLGYTIYSYWVFRGKVEPHEGYH